MPTQISEINIENASLVDRMNHYHVFGASVAVIHNDQIASAEGFGVCEAGKPEPVTPETLFQAASISKFVAAVAVLRLVEAGLLHLDEDVNAYLTSWKIPTKGDWQPRVTLRHLLSHSAGLTVHGFPGYPQGHPLPTTVQILNGEAPANTPPVEVDIPPGLQNRYSGGGTTVVQQILMDVLRQPFPQIAREWVLDPAGMTHSTYEQPIPLDQYPNVATAHPQEEPIAGRFHTYPEMAAAGLWTTASDLARFALAFQRARAGKPGAILSPASVLEMLTPPIPASIPDPNTGLGLFLFGEGASRRFGHNGCNAGFESRLIASENHGYGLAILVNSNQGGTLMNEIEQAVEREYDWQRYPFSKWVALPIAPAVLERCVGVYELRPSCHITITRTDDQLWMRQEGQPAFPLYPETETHYYAPAVKTSVTFLGTKSGAAERLTLYQDENRFTARRC